LAVSYDFLHEFTGYGVLNIVCAVLSKLYLPFSSYDSEALTFGWKLASFNTDIFDFNTKI